MRWTAGPQTPGRSTILVGLTNFQHAMFTLADIAQPGVSMYGRGDRRGQPWPRMASGPGRRHPGVCALWSLFDQRGSRLAGPPCFVRPVRYSGGDQTTVEVLCADSDRAAAVMGETKPLAPGAQRVPRPDSVVRVRDVRTTRRTSELPRAAGTRAREPGSCRPGVLEAIEAQVVRRRSSSKPANGKRPAPQARGALCTGRRAPARPTPCAT